LGLADVAPSWVALVLVGLLAFAVVARGGFDPSTRVLVALFAAIVSVASMAVLSWSRRDLITPVTVGAIGLGGLIVVSAGANSAWQAGLAAVAITMSLIAVVLVTRRLAPSDRTLVLDGCAWVGAVAALVGMVAVLLRQQPPRAVRRDPVAQRHDDHLLERVRRAVRLFGGRDTGTRSDRRDRR
jgi:hypothetical protein